MDSKWGKRLQGNKYHDLIYVDISWIKMNNEHITAH